MEQGVTITANNIITVAAIISALSVIFGVIFAVYKWYYKQNEKDKRHDSEISRIKEENTLIVYALRACLDGLQQLGANHTVPDAKNKLDKYINKQAHK